MKHFAWVRNNTAFQIITRIPFCSALPTSLLKENRLYLFKLKAVERGRLIWTCDMVKPSTKASPPTECRLPAMKLSNSKCMLRFLIRTLFRKPGCWSHTLAWPQADAKELDKWQKTATWAVNEGPEFEKLIESSWRRSEGLCLLPHGCISIHANTLALRWPGNHLTCIRISGGNPWMVEGTPAM